MYEKHFRNNFAFQTFCIGNHFVFENILCSKTICVRKYYVFDKLFACQVILIVFDLEAFNWKCNERHVFGSVAGARFKAFKMKYQHGWRSGNNQLFAHWSLFFTLIACWLILTGQIFTALVFFNAFVQRTRFVYW